MKLVKDELFLIQIIQMSFFGIHFYYFLLISKLLLIMTYYIIINFNRCLYFIKQN